MYDLTGVECIAELTAARYWKMKNQLVNVIKDKGIILF
jgi:hypothetical protein